MTMNCAVEKEGGTMFVCVRIMARSHARHLLVHTCVLCQKVEEAFRSLSHQAIVSLLYILKDAFSQISKLFADVI